MVQWFSKLGFSQYPLDARSNPNLVGVDDIEKKLIEYILQGNMCLLCGLTGTGKTSMIQRIMLSNQLKDFELFYVSSDGVKKDRDIDDLVKEKMSIFARLLFMKPKNMIIFLDECQLASRVLTESIKSKWNETKGDRKVIHSVVVSQISPRLQSNFSGSFMDRLGKRVIKMKKLSSDQLEEVLRSRLQLKKYNYVDKFSSDGLKFLLKSCDGSVRQLLEYTDAIFRELDTLDEKSLLDKKFKITKEHVFNLMQRSGLVVDLRSEFTNKKQTFANVFSSSSLKKATEMFNEFGVMDTVLLAEKLDVTKRTAQGVIRSLLKEGAILISHSEDKEKYYVLTPRMKHELVSE
jgi:arsenate reductase-like glutaredoxin family protein